MATATESKSVEPYFPERWVSTVREETLAGWILDIERKMAPMRKELARMEEGVAQIQAELRRRGAARKGRNGKNGRAEAVAHEDPPPAGGGMS